MQVLRATKTYEQEVTATKNYRISRMPLIAGTWFSRAKLIQARKFLYRSFLHAAIFCHGEFSPSFSHVLKKTGVNGNGMTFASAKPSNFRGDTVANRAGSILAASMSEIVVGLS
jgi:hypothetical protein